MCPCGSMEERLTTDQAVAGSSPATDDIFRHPPEWWSRGSMEERWTSDPTVAGSSPAAIALCHSKAP